MSIVNDSSLSAIAPGTRVRIRGEEWLVRKVDRTAGGQQRILALGTSQLVRNRESIFIQELEDEIEIVDPAKTVPVIDESAHYRDARLHLEFLLRDTTPSDERIHTGHRAAMDVVPYQLDPAFLSLQQPRQRILISDAVGLGKTIECGVLLTELIQRGRGRRILVLAVKSMLTQFQKELWARFDIPLTRMDSAALQRIRTQIPANHNPFHTTTAPLSPSIPSSRMVNTGIS
jgi:SNF2 family DNA or RNA helicase